MKSTLVNIIGFGNGVEDENQHLSLVVSDHWLLEKIRQHRTFFNNDGNLSMLHMALLEGLTQDSSQEDKREFLENFGFDEDEDEDEDDDEDKDEEEEKGTLDWLLRKVDEVHELQGYMSSQQMDVINCIVYID